MNTLTRYSSTNYKRLFSICDNLYYMIKMDKPKIILVITSIEYIEIINEYNYKRDSQQDRPDFDNIIIFNKFEKEIFNPRSNKYEFNQIIRFLLFPFKFDIGERFNILLNNLRYEKNILDKLNLFDKLYFIKYDINMKNLFEIYSQLHSNILYITNWNIKKELKKLFDIPFDIPDEIAQKIFSAYTFNFLYPNQNSPKINIKHEFTIVDYYLSLDEDYAIPLCMQDKKLCSDRPLLTTLPKTDITLHKTDKTDNTLPKTEPIETDLIISRYEKSKIEPLIYLSSDDDDDLYS